MRYGHSLLSTLGAISALILTSAAAALGQEIEQNAADIKSSVRAYRVANEVKIIKEFSGLLSIPNVSSDTADIRKNAEKIAAMLEARGIKASLLQVEGAPPLVYGELSAPGADMTLAIYAHYDGQPVVPEKWATGPWEPALRDGPLEDGGKVVPWDQVAGRLNEEWRLYARGSGDDKAPIIAWLTAVDALREKGIPLSVNLEFFLEGEEEAGSQHLPAILDAHGDLLGADLLLICDGPVHQSRRMQLFFGARGIVGLEMTVYGPIRALHSGHYGNWAPNPAAMLANLLAGMRDADGGILIPDFMEQMRPLTESEHRALASAPDIDSELRRSLGLGASEAGNAPLVERIMLPALNIRGISVGEVSDKAKNAVPTEAAASIDFRLVPDLTPAGVKALVEKHIRGQGYHIVYMDPDTETRLAYPRVVKLTWEDGYPPARTPMDLPISRALITVIEEITDDPLVVMPTLGGSVPLYLFIEKFGCPVIGLPMANHDNNQHAPNENLRLRNLWDAIEINAAILAKLGLHK
jgi:acetylornithine deacetylase/succinyl-diaminopimelate desuccinylase-like protein